MAALECMCISIFAREIYLYIYTGGSKASQKHDFARTGQTAGGKKWPLLEHVSPACLLLSPYPNHSLHFSSHSSLSVSVSLSLSLYLFLLIFVFFLTKTSKVRNKRHTLSCSGQRVAQGSEQRKTSTRTVEGLPDGACWVFMQSEKRENKHKWLRLRVKVHRESPFVGCFLRAARPCEWAHLCTRSENTPPRHREKEKGKEGEEKERDR